MKEQSKIGQAFAEGFKDFSVEPRPKVWKNVKTGIPGSSVFSFLNIFIASIALVSVIGVGFYFLNPTEKSTQEISNLQINDNVQAVEQVVDNQNSVINANIENATPSTEVLNSSNTNTAIPENKTPNTSIQIQTQPNQNISQNQNTATSSSLNMNDIHSHANATTFSDSHQPQSQPAQLTSTVKDSTIRYSSNPIICFGENARLEVFGGESYFWENGSVMSYNVVEPVRNSTYSVIVTDKYGYQHKHDFQVVIDKECTSVFAPSAFSPNGDGLNDEFKAVGENISEFNMQIMTREGKMVFVCSDINLGWNGTLNGELMASGVYVYQIVYKNAHDEQKVLKGYFTLVR